MYCITIDILLLGVIWLLKYALHIVEKDSFNKNLVLSIDTSYCDTWELYGQQWLLIVHTAIYIDSQYTRLANASRTISYWTNSKFFVYCNNSASRVALHNENEEHCFVLYNTSSRGRQKKVNLGKKNVWYHFFRSFYFWVDSYLFCILHFNILTFT